MSGSVPSWFCCGDPGPHPDERLGHPPHGALAERTVTGERRAEWMRGEEAEQETGSRPGISAVERVRRPLEPPGPPNCDRAAVGERRDLDPQLAQHAGSGPGIQTRQHPANVARAPGHRPEEERAVGEALVAGDSYRAMDQHRVPRQEVPGTGYRVPSAFLGPPHLILSAQREGSTPYGRWVGQTGGSQVRRLDPSVASLPQDEEELYSVLGTRYSVPATHPAFSEKLPPPPSTS